MSVSGYKTERIPHEDVVLIFESKNPITARIILKVIVYAPIEKHGETYYNLGFGDYNEETGKPDSKITSDNGDMRKVLRTVVSTLPQFFAQFPDATVHITGSDETRNNYYQKLVKDYGSEISTQFIVQGRSMDKVEDFRPNISYEFILIKLKKP